MFDFEKLIVYQKANALQELISKDLIYRNDLDKIIKDQLKRASLSIVLNISEGASRFSKADRAKFYVIARGSVFECVSIFEVLKKSQSMNSINWDLLFDYTEQISKMLFTMIKNLKG